MNRLLTKDTILSIDTETTGLIAGVHSMIQLGAVAYRNGKEVGHFIASLDDWEGSIRDEDTMKFWQRNQDRWKAIRAKKEKPEVVMPRFYDFVADLPKPVTLAGNPLCFDSAFVFWYLHNFVSRTAVNELFKRHRGIDIRTFQMALLGTPYSESERMYLPKEWEEGHEITHDALDDARNQGSVLMNLMKISVGEMEFPATAAGA